MIERRQRKLNTVSTHLLVVLLSFIDRRIGRTQVLGKGAVISQISKATRHAIVIEGKRSGS